MANKHAKAKNLRARALVSLVAIIVVVAVCAYLGLCGFGKGTMINYLKPWGDAISLGLDLRGGVYTVYQAENNGDPDFDTKMESTVSILTSRLTRQGFTEATVTRQGSDRIRVEIPNVSDPNQILTIIGTPAQLYFVDESGNNLMEGLFVNFCRILNRDHADHGRHDFRRRRESLRRNIKELYHAVFSLKHDRKPSVGL